MEFSAVGTGRGTRLERIPPPPRGFRVGADDVAKRIRSAKEIGSGKM
jgi:hypothetical protein